MRLPKASFDLIHRIRKDTRHFAAIQELRFSRSELLQNFYFMPEFFYMKGVQANSHEAFVDHFAVDVFVDDGLANVIDGFLGPSVGRPSVLEACVSKELRMVQPQQRHGEATVSSAGTKADVVLL